MKKLIIYGINQQAQQLKYFIENDQLGNIEAYTVDRDFKKIEFLDGIPVVCFEDILQLYNPNEYEIVLSFGYNKMMDVRKEKYELCKSKGYKIFTYVSKDAKVYTQSIGEGTIIYPNVVLSPNTIIGICNFFEVSVTIAHNTIIGNFNFFAPNATVSGNTNIGNNCFFGISSIVFNNLKISDYTLVGAGAILDSNSQVGEAIKFANSILLKKDSKNYL